GDIRRGLLKSISMDAPVSAVMNPNPFTLRADATVRNDEVQLYMRQHGIRQIPIVDANEKLCGIYLDDSLGTRNNTVVLMVGGLGSRLGDLTKDCPKPLLAVGDKPILETIIENFSAQGFRNIVLALNYKGEMIADYFGDGSRNKVNIKYLWEDKPLGTAGALSLLAAPQTAPMIIMNGDVLTQMRFGPMVDYHDASGKMATMCIREFKFQVPFGVVRHTGNTVMDIVEKPEESFMVSAGINVLDPSALQYIPKNTKFDMPDLFKAMIADQKDVGAYAIREYWIDIGRREEYQKAQTDFVASIAKAANAA
ncbi:MAG: nucleotidyltransferase family protein, partial [Alphaproteobacteria bacterium]|nr:nucleotidyltransferase family protein [Alphaproteobacteria bacterium]